MSLHLKGIVPALGLALLMAGCAGRVRDYGGVEVEQGLLRRPLDGAAVTKRSAAAIAIVETDVGRGMGFVIDPSGYLITNRHVLEDADHVERVIFPAMDPPLSVATVYVAYVDPLRDLALLNRAVTGEPVADGDPDCDASGEIDAADVACTASKVFTPWGVAPMCS